MKYHLRLQAHASPMTKPAQRTTANITTFTAYFREARVLRRFPRTSGDIPEHWRKRASRGWQLAVPVEDRFDVVPVRVNDERCVIPGVVMRAKTRRAVVAAAGFDSGAVELVNGGSVGCGEGHMNGSGRRFPFPDPEISTALDGEPRPLRALHYLHSERLEGLLVEGAAASQVTYSQGQVVDEGKRHGSDTPSILERDLRGHSRTLAPSQRGVVF